MDSFVYYTPTKVFFGESSVNNLGPYLKQRGYHRILIHYGSGSVRQNGALDDVMHQLDGAGVEYVEFSGVKPNPRVELVREGVVLCKERDIDFILGVGGGSVSDSCKAIALGLATGIDPWEALTAGVAPPSAFPFGMVLTIAAAGSEMSNSCVINNMDLGLKCSCSHETNRPQVAFLDPSYTLSVPPYQTAAGAVDIMMHTMERYLTNEPDTPLTDGLAESLLVTVLKSMEILRDNPFDMSARSNLMWASSLSHNDLTGCGRNKTFTAHKLEHPLSGFDANITHGAGLAVVFPAWCLFEYRQGIDRFARFAKNIWSQEETEDKDAMVLGAVQAMKATFSSWGLPTTMGELGISPDDYDEIIDRLTQRGTKNIPSFRGPLGKEEILQIYKLAEG